MLSSTRLSLRKKGLALLVAGALASLGLAAQSAQAQNPAGADRAAYLAAKCDHLTSNPAEHAGCYAQESLNFERARGTEADRQNAALSTVIECGNFLKAGRDKTFTREKVLELAGGKVTPENMCEVARKLGYTGRKAAVDARTR
jgi:hypothetical protein